MSKTARMEVPQAKESMDKYINIVLFEANRLKELTNDAMDKFKMEVASELGVNLKDGYNGDLTSKEAGSIGGEMVRQMIKKQEESMR